MTWYEYSHIGSRPVNEDSVCVIEGKDCFCFVVADGLGGHGKGDVASQAAVAAFREVFSGDVGVSLTEAMASAFRLAQERILEQQQRAGTPFRMKTTAAAVAIRGEEVVRGYIGDSRIYTFSTFRCVRTMDHSVPQMLVMSGEIKEKEIRGHADRNRLLRVLGEAGAPRFEIETLQPLKKYRGLLLCSDGFWELIEDKEMHRLLKQSRDAEQWCRQMAQLVEQRGAGTDMDNNSAIAIMR